MIEALLPTYTMENNRTVELIHVACCFFNHKNIALLKLIKLEPLSTAATPVYSTRLPLHFEMYKKNSFMGDLITLQVRRFVKQEELKTSSKIKKLIKIYSL